MKERITIGKNGLVTYRYNCSNEVGFELHLFSEIGEPFKARFLEIIKEEGLEILHGVEIGEAPWAADFEAKRFLKVTKKGAGAWAAPAYEGQPLSEWPLCMFVANTIEDDEFASISCGGGQTKEDALACAIRRIRRIGIPELNRQRKRENQNG